MVILHPKIIPQSAIPSGANGFSDIIFQNCRFPSANIWVKKAGSTDACKISSGVPPLKIILKTTFGFIILDSGNSIINIGENNAIRQEVIVL